MRLTKQIKKKFYIPEDPDNGWIEIKRIKPSKQKEIDAKVNDITFRDGAAEVKFNPYMRAKAITNACLTGWGNMFDTMGKAMPFQQSNVTKAADFVIKVDDKEFDFYSWVTKCHEELDAEVLGEQEEAEKN